MKRFAFRLDRVLRLRQQQTEQARRTLAIAMAAEDQARRLVDSAFAALNARLAEVRHKERAGMTAFDFANLRSHVRVLQGHLEVAEAGLADARSQTEQRRTELLEARRREKALERLRERRLADYTLEALREEQKELDEFGDRQALNVRVARSEI